MFRLMRVSAHQFDHHRQRASLRCQHLYQPLCPAQSGCISFVADRIVLLWFKSSSPAAVSSSPPNTQVEWSPARQQSRLYWLKPRLAILAAAFLTHAHAAEADRDTPAIRYFG